MHRECSTLDQQHRRQTTTASRFNSFDSECANIGRNGVPFRCRLNTLKTVHLERTLSVQQHIKNICRGSFLEFRRVTSSRPCQSQSAAARLVAAMVISRFDYCNSIFTGLPADQIARLQRVQNNIAWLRMKQRKT